MAVYAIGDVQGCFDELLALLDRIGFNPGTDSTMMPFCASRSSGTAQTESTGVLTASGAPLRSKTMPR